MSVRECDRCHGTTKGGVRCSRTTCQTARYCWQHLIKESGLRVRRSSIPRAGLGLYAEKDYPKGKLIGAYTGDIIDKAELDKRYGKNTQAAYVLGTAKNRFIDARSTQSCVARYANGCDKPRSGSKVKCNADFTTRANLRATRKIEKGDEIFARYGRSYWKGK
jgi:uncharacterized protein